MIKDFDFDYDEDEQIELFSFMDESEQEKLIYQEDSTEEYEESTSEQTISSTSEQTMESVIHKNQLESVPIADSSAKPMLLIPLSADINAICKTCVNCQYRSITEHTKELRCSMFDCDMHRLFTECRGYEAKKSAT